ncbi:MAG: two-component regulator propeller domain-containing protein, partial [Bacteroidota bacterium]
MSRTYKYLGFFSILLMFQLPAVAQSRWSGYYSYRPCSDVVESDHFVVGGTALGLILYHKETGSVNIRNKINGLSDSGISAIGVAEEEDLIFVGYGNGNIDVIKDGTVTNIPDLKIESMTGNKQINHFNYNNGSIFCSTNFGILEIDIQKNEIASTFIIGENATDLKVYKTIVSEDYIYAATEFGIRRAEVNNSALAYYENWELLTDKQSYVDIEGIHGRVIGAQGRIGETCHLMNVEGDLSDTLKTIKRFRTLNKGNGKLLVSAENQLLVYDDLDTSPQVFRSLAMKDESVYTPKYRNALFNDNNDLWIADFGGGLLKTENNQTFDRILPSGPRSNSVFCTKSIGNQLWILPGGFSTLNDNAKHPPVISILQDGDWSYLTKDNVSQFDSRAARDLINITEHPFKKNNVFVSSWGNGVFEFSPDEDGNYTVENHFTEKNSKLHNFPGTLDSEFVRIWGLTFDAEGKLYMTNSDVDIGVVVYDTGEDEWYNYDYEALALDYNKIGEIVIDDYNQKWVNIVHGPAKGLFVFDDNNTPEVTSDDVYRSTVSQSIDGDNRNAGIMRLWDENGEELTDVVYSIAKDHNGYIWIGTDNGVVVQYNPGRIFDIAVPEFTRIKVPRNDGSDLADYLLENQRIRAIAVDGGNRKYIGTEGSGLYIISEDGIKTVNHFTTNNSPLPSNNISNININEQTGEVFVSTDVGLISYRGDAIQGKSEYSNVYAYP